MVTPLVMAALSGQSEAVALLLTRGADPDIETSAMGTALHAAAQRGFQEVARALPDAGAGTETGNPDGYTPLMIAALKNQTNVLGLPVEDGADIHAMGVPRGNGMGGNGRICALHVAAFDGETEAAGLLRSTGAGPLGTEAQWLAFEPVIRTMGGASLHVGEKAGMDAGGAFRGPLHRAAGRHVGHDPWRAGLPEGGHPGSGPFRSRWA
ncbi:ankyrin repeat domain-containing protein [Ovoidimarina sediminis]|uniref:ankyrin repeat domain-containing protein n=1 Tax=Ovoidimarina sediminis TaxID=3079856 RepID=UPI002914E62E|nr:ankyrin repeat domain-containing protein [Rhodophyticola sp. MJ-SS7]MDU8943384.1 ankyrin repeat domain-containing protein [Rhodophyticola sp. MJ-SS7]